MRGSKRSLWSINLQRENLQGRISAYPRITSSTRRLYGIRDRQDEPNSSQTDSREGMLRCAEDLRRAVQNLNAPGCQILECAMPDTGIGIKGIYPTRWCGRL